MRIEHRTIPIPPCGINALQEALGVKEQVQRLVGALEHEYINAGKGDSRPLAVSPHTGTSRPQARKPPKPSPPAGGVAVERVAELRLQVLVSVTASRLRLP